jgi:hypothetical protein
LYMKTLVQLFFCLSVAFMFGCSSGSPKVETAPGKPVAMPTASVETGNGPAEKDLPKVLDLPLYPGSKVVKNKLATAGAETRYHVTLETSDPVQKVADFYQANGLPSMVHAGMGQAVGETKNGNEVLIDFSRKGEKTQIAIRVSAGGKHA